MPYITESYEVVASNSRVLPSDAVHPKLELLRFMRRFTLLVVPLVLFGAALSAAQHEQWSVALPAPAFSPTLYPNASDPSGVLVSAGAQLMHVDGAGEVIWTLDHDGVLQSSPTAADLDGDGSAEIAVANAVGRVLVYAADGALRWSHDFDTPTGSFKHIVAADVHPHDGLELIVGFDDGWLNCLNADGKLLWRFFGDRFRVGGIAVGDATGDGFTDIVYGTDNGNVYCLDGWGFVQWRYQEVAPYGRSGPVLVDLDGDGAAEVLITRSNQGTATCQMALDGRTGAFKWRAPTYMQGYHSNTIVDLDGDGSFEVLSADKGNVLTAVRADGSKLWEAALEGRGIFWAPAIGDVDGDGQLDIVTGVRGASPEDGACVYRVSAEGEILDRLALGSSANAAPAMGDLNDDGTLDVLVCLDGPPRLAALSWGGTGAVAWPSVHGDSAMRSVARVNAGVPIESDKRERVGTLKTSSPSTMYWGTNRIRPSWDDTDQPEAGAFFTTSGVRELGAVEHRVIPLDRTQPSNTPIEFYLAGHDPVDVHLALHDADGSVVFRDTKTYEPRLPDKTWRQSIEPAEYLRARGDEAGADLRMFDRYEQRMTLLDKQVQASAADPEAIEETVQRVEELREAGEDYMRFRLRCSSFWSSGGRGAFAAYLDRNPWDNVYGTMAGLVDAIDVNAYRDEFESIAVNLSNLSAETIDVRCSFTPPSLNARPERTPDMAQRVTLRRCVPVPKRGGGYVFDALPELDRSGVITLPPGETRQVWLVIDTHGLDDGEYELDLFAGSMTHPPTVQQIRINLNVWQVQLPKGVYAQMNWGHVGLNETSDQVLQDMLDHGVSVAYAPGLPLLPVDENGQANGEPDWTAFDAALERLPDYFQLMFHGALRPQWPEGVSAEAQQAAEDAATASGIEALADHMNEIGWGYDRWAFYFIDEPFLTGRTVIPELRERCEFVRAIDPKIRLYANPTGKMKVEYLDEFKELIDVWQPEINYLKRDPDLLEWFQQNAKTLWAYEATDPGKELLPLGYYRSLGWLASKLQLTGAGFWVYQYHDLWWPLEVGNWAVVYPAGDEVVPSRRWEACRDGQEDFLALHLLREEIRKAREGHRFEEADKAEALLNEALDNVAGWQIGTIDEITRQTRDYELDFGLLQEYRIKIAETIIDLRASGAHNPIHFLGD